MAAPLVRGADRNMSVGRVFERAISTIAHNPLVTLGLAFLFGAIPGTLMTWGVSVAQRLTFTPSFSSGYLALIYVAMIGTWVLGLAVSALVQGVLTRATVAESEGRRASLAECLRAGLPAIIPLIILSILLAICVAIGFVLLIVPGVFLYISWSVAAPALIEERRGIAGSFRRSWELTSGAKWKILAILLILYILYYLLSGVFALMSAWLLGGRGMSGFGQEFTTGLVVMNLVLSLVVNLFWGSVQASLFVELRDWKDGPSVDNLEEVFA